MIIYVHVERCFHLVKLDWPFSVKPKLLFQELQPKKERKKSSMAAEIFFF